MVAEVGTFSVLQCPVCWKISQAGEILTPGCYLVYHFFILIWYDRDSGHQYSLDVIGGNVTLIDVKQTSSGCSYKWYHKKTVLKGQLMSVLTNGCISSEKIHHEHSNHI